MPLEKVQKIVDGAKDVVTDPETLRSVAAWAIATGAPTAVGAILPAISKQNDWIVYGTGIGGAVGVGGAAVARLFVTQETMRNAVLSGLDRVVPGLTGLTAANRIAHARDLEAKRDLEANTVLHENSMETPAKPANPVNQHKGVPESSKRGSANR